MKNKQSFHKDTILNQEIYHPRFHLLLYLSRKRPFLLS